MPSVIPSRTRTPLILCLNFTFPRPWNEMTPSERAKALGEIRVALVSEAWEIDQEIRIITKGEENE